MIRLKTILHPTDLSESSRYALEVAAALARDQGARVVLLHVLPKAAPIGRDVNVPAYKESHTAEDLEAYRREMVNCLDKVRREFASVLVEPLVKEGEVAGTIARTADEVAADLIVLGSHGRSRMYEVMLGSVAAEVARKASRPVVTVRVPAPGAVPTVAP